MGRRRGGPPPTRRTRTEAQIAALEDALQMQGFHSYDTWSRKLGGDFMIMNRRGLFIAERRGPRGGWHLQLRAELVPLFRAHFAAMMLNGGQWARVNVFEEEARCLGLMP